MKLKGNNLIYLIFIGLLAIYILSNLFNRPPVRSFESVLVSVDTSQASKVVITPKEGGTEIALSRNGHQWMSQSGDIQSLCPPNVIQGILRELSEIKTKRLVGRSGDKFEDYGVTPESGTQVRVFKGSKLLEDFIIGRFNFNQQSRTALSYIRKTASDDTYAVEGFIGLSFDQSFDNFRDKRIVDLSSAEITEIRYNTGGQSYSLVKENEQWNANGVRIDSTNMANYLSSVSQLSGRTFYDNPFNFDDSDQSIQFKTSTYEQKVEVWDDPAMNGSYVIKSSVNPDVGFQSDTTGIYKTLIVEMDMLIGLDQ